MKLFVARFWRDFKESEAVYVNYFYEAVPFWECAVETVAEFNRCQQECFCTFRPKLAPFLYKPQKKFGTLAGFSRREPLLVPRPRSATYHCLLVTGTVG